MIASVGAPALACTLEAPPHWPSILRPGGPPVFLGRVVQISLEDQPRRIGAFEVTEATALIRPIEIVQGLVQAQPIITGAVSVRKLAPEAPSYCGDYLRLDIADPVLVLTRPDGSYRALPASEVGEPSLQRVFEKHR